MTISINITGLKLPCRTSIPPFPISAMFAVWKERRELSRMSDSRLRDLGISPIDAAKEIARPIWDLPKCRR